MTQNMTVSDIRVYVANLGKYNEGELVGDWFALPIDEEDMKERVGLNHIYEEYAIHNYECPFRIEEYTSISELNRLYNQLCDIDDDLINHIDYLIGELGSIEEVISNAQDIIVYKNTCLYDLAQEFVEEGLFGEVPQWLTNYIDYEAIARSLDYDGYCEQGNDVIFINN